MINFFQKKGYLTSTLMMMSLLILFGGAVYFAISASLEKNVEESLVELSKQGSKTVRLQLDIMLELLSVMAANNAIKDPAVPLEQKVSHLQMDSTNADYLRTVFANETGEAIDSHGEKYSVDSTEYFKQAISGTWYVSDPIISEKADSMTMIVAIPVKYEGRIVGVIASVYNGDVLSKIVGDIRLGEHGNSFINNSIGITIAHDDRSLVLHEDNDFINVLSNPALKPLADLERMMVEGKTGAGKYTYRGIDKYMGFAPIPGTGWSLAVAAPKSQVFSTIDRVMKYVMFAVIVLGILFIAIRLYIEYLQENIKKEKEYSGHITDAARLMIINCDQAGYMKYVNKYAGESLGYDAGQMTGKSIYDIVLFPEKKKFEEIFTNALKNDEDSDFELTMQKSDHSKIYLTAHLLPSIGISGKRMQIIGMDITKRVDDQKKLQSNFEEMTALYEEMAATEEELRFQYDELEKSRDIIKESEERYRLVFEASNDGLWETDYNSGMRIFSDRWMEIFHGVNQIEPEDAYWDRVYSEDLSKTRLAYEKHINRESPYYFAEYRMVMPNGDLRWVLARGKAHFDENGKPIRMAGSHTDITDKKIYEKNIYELAYVDTLTGLPNKAALVEYLEHVCSKSSTHPVKSGSILMIDIDNFYMINETFGQAYGDQVLKYISEKINSMSQNGYKVYRLSGDEFIWFLPEVSDKDEIVAVMRNLQTVINVPFNLDGSTLHILITIGAVVFTNENCNAWDLLKNAEIAMYKAKTKGKNSYEFFDSTLVNDLHERSKMENGLRSALINNEFELYYQPQIDLYDGKICGYEALVRWNSPDYGFVQPGRFINISEKTGLIIPLGKWIFASACRFATRINAYSTVPITVSVNVSSVQIMQNEFVEDFLRIIDETEVDPHLISIEITETALMESFDINVGKLILLKERGLTISLDDFGTGYSSISYLKKLPVDFLKIEKVFIDDIIDPSKNVNFAAIIIDLAHKLGMKAVAEGIEQEEQLEKLQMYSCDRIQGYIISKPLPADDAIKLFDNLMGKYKKSI